MSEKQQERRSLRADAEARLASKPMANVAARPAEELLHELQVHQIELEMQNETLREAQIALEESPDRYVDLYEFAPISYLTLDESGLIVDFNLTGAALLGVERRKLLNSRFAQRLIAPQDQERWQHFLSGTLQHDERQTCEMIMQRGDGSCFPARLDCKYSAMVGGTRSLRITMTDITQMRHASETLREKEESLRTIINQVIVGIVQADLAGHIVFVNDHYCEITGYQREELLGKRWQDLTHPEDGSRNDAFLAQIARADKPVSFEKRYIRKDGETVWVSISTSMQRSNDGRILGGLAVVVDITDHKRAADLLRRSSDEIADIYNRAPCGYHSIDKHGIIRRINDTELEWLGYTRDEVIGRIKVTDLLTPASQQIFRETYPCFMSQGFVNDLELEMIRKDGGIFTALVNATAIYDASGHYAMSRSSILDITARKQAEDKLKESRQLLRDLVDKSESLREEERKRISLEVHDELGQILTALRMDVALINLRFGEHNAALLEKTQDMMGLLDRASQSVRNIVSNLRPTVLDMGIVPAVGWLCDDFTSRMRTSCVLHATEERIDLDEVQAVAVFRMVQELLTNAARHAKASSVRISLARHGNDLRVEVRDNGKGFDPAAKAMNLSFGLLGIRERAMALGGTVEIVSTPSQGTAATIIVPTRQGAMQKERRKS